MWIPRTVLYPNAEVHSGPSQAFKTVIFQRTANDFKSTSLTFFFFYKTFHYRCLKGSWTNWMFLNPWLDKWISTLSKYERCPVFTIQFGIRSHVLPIWIKLWRPDVFFIFTRKHVRAQKIAHSSEVLCAQVHPIGITHTIGSNLYILI